MGSGSKEEDAFVGAVYPKLPSEIGTDDKFKRKIVWINVFGFVLLHMAGFYGVWLCLWAKMWTNLYMLLLMYIGGEGVAVGAHRLYSHKAFKATFLVRLMLIIFHTMAGQNCLYIWVRDHRLHHKYSDTDADPHNSNRGFFFSHMGWLMSRKHPMVIAKGKTIDMSDLEADPLVMFQKKFYKALYGLFAIAIPVAVPVRFWGETYWNSLFIAYFARYVLLLHVTWLINSAAHIYGNRPFDKEIKAVENRLIAYASIGEGWHNYHHAFPWDYRTAELGSGFSPSTNFIEFFAFLGQIYDLRTTPYTIIEGRARKKGDGTHPVFGEKEKGA